MVAFTTCNSTNAHFGKWYFSLCDKNLNVNTEFGHINSRLHQHRERLFFSVKKY